MSTIDLSMYPNPPNGFKRICIELEPKDNEEFCKIELIPGKKNEGRLQSASFGR